MAPHPNLSPQAGGEEKDQEHLFMAPPPCSEGGGWGESVINEHSTESSHLRLSGESASNWTLWCSLEERAPEGGGWGESVINEHLTESPHLRITDEGPSDWALFRSLFEGAKEGEFALPSGTVEN